MRHVEKHYDTPAVVAHKAELIRQQLDEESLCEPGTRSGKTGAQLYDIVRDMPTLQALKEQMYAEQGGVCCYCGMKLEYPYDPQYRVEHVHPKERYRELVGEYKNLLLSCRATKEETDIRAKKPKDERKEYIHCDEAKGSKEITYSPLYKTCEKVFKYTLDGEVLYNDDDAWKDITILGLNGAYLKRRRKAAIDALVLGGNVLNDDDLRAFQAGLLSRNADGKFAEFYFVIADAINEFFPTL